jgi:ribokinase
MRALIVGSYVNAVSLCVARLPNAGESIAATDIIIEHGGKGLNLAIGLHRLGADVRLLLNVGRDASGRALRGELEAIGMDVSLVREVETLSGFGVGFLTPEGENCISVFAGANMTIREEEVEAAASVIVGADWVVGQFEAPDVALLSAFELGKASGANTYLNPSPWRRPSAALLALTDALVMNESEAASFFDDDSLRSASIETWRRILATPSKRRGWRGQWLIVTLGARGAIGLFPTEDVRYAPSRAVEQVDATGAGDAFGAGFMWALSTAGSQQALAFANACGALTARRKGVWRSLPSQAEALAFM